MSERHGSSLIDYSFMCTCTCTCIANPNACADSAICFNTFTDQSAIEDMLIESGFYARHFDVSWCMISKTSCMLYHDVMARHCMLQSIFQYFVYRGIHV